MAPPTDSPRLGFDRRLRTSICAVLLSGVAVTGAGLAFFGVVPAVSLAGGAAAATGNLWAMGKIVLALLPDNSAGARAQSRAGWAFVAVLKMVGLLGGTWLLMRHGWVHPLPMLVGFLSLPIGIVIGSLVSDRNDHSDGF